MVDAFPKVAVLIGSADGKMDDAEKEWSKKVTHIRTFAGREDLFELYAEVKKSMETRIAELIEDYSKDAVSSELGIIRDLEDVNVILKNMDPVIGGRLVKDLKSFARHIGKASGGFMRFFSETKEERDLAKLPMLEDISYEDEEE